MDKGTFEEMAPELLQSLEDLVAHVEAWSSAPPVMRARLRIKEARERRERPTSTHGPTPTRRFDVEIWCDEGEYDRKVGLTYEQVQGCLIAWAPNMKEGFSLVVREAR